MPPVGRTRRALVAVAVLVPLASTGCTDDREARLDRPAASVDPAVLRDEAASDLVGELEDALLGRSEDLAPLSRSDAARDELRSAAANVKALGLRQVGLRYLATSSDTLSDQEQARLGSDAWMGDVQVSWFLPGVDERPSLLTIPVVLSGTAGEQRFVSFRSAAAERVPLWLLTRLSVVRGPSTVVAAPDPGSAGRLSALAERAVTTVRQTLPSWRQRLLVQETPSQRDFQLAAGLPGPQARAVAGVTTTPDGSADAGSRGQVFINPKLFDPLGAEGRQIVVSHESAHVALGAATTRMPLWLSEGTADWVALRRSPLPVSRLASQVLEWVRESGGPKALPGPAAFDGTDKRIGAWYEAAWLAVKRLADEHGAPALLRFYRVVARTGRTEPAFRQVLGSDEQSFVRDWRSYLESLA